MRRYVKLARLALDEQARAGGETPGSNPLRGSELIVYTCTIGTESAIVTHVRPNTARDGTGLWRGCLAA
jgi:hypothetical protein